MSIRRVADSLYHVVVFVRINGKIIHRQATITGSKDAAKAKEVTIKAELREGAAGSSLTTFKAFSEALKFYTERKEVGKSLPYFNRLTTELGAVKISELAERFDCWLLDLKRRKRMYTERLISSATINRYLAWSNAALNFAVEYHKLRVNPLAHLKKLEESARDVSFSIDDEKRLLAAIDAEAPHIGPAIRFMLQIPCRRAEIVSMKKADIDLFNNSIRVKNGTTKNGEGISKIIPPDLVGYMRAIPKDCEYVFYRIQGKDENLKYLSLGNFRKSWEASTKHAELAGLRIHDLRHIAATRAIDNGTPAQVVMEQAGWKTDMLRTLYHRSAAKARELWHFQGQSKPECKPPKAEAL